MDKYRYKILEEIGKGSFGRVYKAKKIRSDYAIKKVRCDAPENVELALQEFWTLSTLRSHNNIIRFEECYLQHGKEIRPMKHGDKFSPGYMYLVEMAIKGKRGWDQAQYYLWFVMEYCNCGDMNDYILDRDPITYLNTIFMLQLADGMAFLHKSNVVHRDIKPENILVRALKGKDPVLKIADFGLSKVCNRPAKDSEDGPRDYDCDINVDTCWLSSACGSDFFMAPEVFEGRYTAKADVFALGIMFWAIMDRITFIDAGTKKVLLGTYVRRDKEVLPVGEALLDDPNLDMTQLLVDTGQGPASGQRSKRSQLRSCVAGNKKKLRDLIAQMVHPNPEFRPSSQELLGKLTSILQPNERPKNMDLTAKKSSVAKIDTILRIEENKFSPENFLPGAKTKTKEMNALSGDRTASNKNSEKFEKKQAQNRKHEKEMQESKTTNQGRRKGHTKNANLQLSSEETNPQAQKVVSNTKKAKRKLASKAQKSKPVTRNLRSSSSKFEISNKKDKRAVTLQKENNETSNSSESIQSCSISVVEEAKTYASDSKSQLPVDESMEVPAQGNGSSHGNKTKLNLRNFVSAAKKFEKPKVISSPVPSLESDEGADFLTDGDSRDSSIVSEVPEFDSGYKSKKSRRISHIVEDTLIEPADKDFSSSGPSKEQVVNSEEIQDEKQTAPITVSETQDLHPPRLHHRPQIGLKQQIRACKPNADIEVSWPYYKSNYSYDSSVPATKIPEFEARLMNTSETPSKPKIEVPRTPCVVMQSKAKFRHNPFHTAVKKRWKYVVLDDFPSPLTNEISLAVKKKDEETAPSKDEMSHVPVKPALNHPHLKMTEHQSSTKHDISSIMNSQQTIPSAPVRKERDFVKTIEQKYIMPEQEAPRQSYSHIGSSIMPSPPNEQILLKSNKNQPSSHRDVVYAAKKVQNFQMKTCTPQNANVKSGTDHLPPYPQDPLVSIHRQQEGMVVKDQDSTGSYQNQPHAFQQGLSGRHPEHAQDPMLQQLTKYWCPSKKIHENPSKSKEALSDARHKSSQKTSLSMTQSPKYPQFLLSCQKTHRTARGHAKGTSGQSKSPESSSIPTIDLTLDDNDDFQPSKKRPRYEETTKYPLQKSRRKFHDPRQSNEISAGTSGAKVVRCGCSNCGKYGTKSKHHSGVSPQASHLGSANPPRLISFQPHISPSHLHLSQETLQRAYTMSESPHYRSDSFSPRSDSSQDLYSLFQRSPQTSSPQSVVRPLQMHSYGVVRDEHGSGSPSLAPYLHGHLMQNRRSPFTGRITTMPVFADDVQRPVPPMPKMPSLLYCGSHSPMSSPDRGQVLQRSPPNLQKIDELNRRVSQQMQQQQIYLSPPKLQRASTVPSMIPQFPGNVVHSPNNNYSTPASSNMCTYPGYPYHLRHQKPILNK